jgi:RecA-family ATPase
MQALALVTDGGSVTVLSHPSLAGIASGTGLSGSTGWQGAFRFHFYLNSSVKSEDEADNNTRLMQFRKKQYGPLSEPIVLSYQRGLFLPVVGTSSIEKAAREARVDELFVHLLKQRNIQNRNVSEAKNANNYAPTVFSEEPEARRDRISKKEFEAAMQRLFKSEKIQNENYGKPSRERCRLVVK